MANRVLADFNDRDEHGRIRIGISPTIVDDQGEMVDAEEGLRVTAYDSTMSVPGTLRTIGGRWVVEARWNEAKHDD